MTTRLPILNHHTHIHTDLCTVENGVYKEIVYDLVTLDISMRWDKDPMVTTRCTLTLPPPNVNEFIPYEDVDERVILKWIADLESDMIERQRMNTQKLMRIMCDDYFRR